MGVIPGGGGCVRGVIEGQGSHKSDIGLALFFFGVDRGASDTCSGGEIGRLAQIKPSRDVVTVGRARRSDLDRFVEHAASLGLREAVAATVGEGDSGWDERLWPAFGPLWHFPILVGRLLIQQ